MEKVRWKLLPILIYPLSILSNHEIVNDVVGGEPVAVTWCPLCYTALVFSRTVDGSADPLTFSVSGQLLQNTLVMFARETDSLRSQLYGAAIDGALAGTIIVSVIWWTFAVAGGALLLPTVVVRVH